ncbi:hypothetical protein NP493_519g02007 [Ridgeia piscesae]|uniref:Apple domain-containing protein n=1 Tax=Ridgeia piscesae TaxID=27915 RepID=A0AAD9KX48_RIDPI|nr:hypothetical protein NP493_519g02007 [Ridgeia piscesae]
MGYAGDKCEDCIGFFVELRNRRMGTSHNATRVNVVKTEDCMAECMKKPRRCAGIDTGYGTCLIHYKGRTYNRSRKNLKKTKRSYHYYLSACDGDKLQPPTRQHGSQHES